MRGVATIDRQPDSDSVVVWVTSVHGLEARHVNAVEVAVDNENELLETISSLTRCSAVLITDGTVLEGMPVEGKPLTLTDIEDLILETESLQVAIGDAVAAYKRRTNSASLRAPVFTPSPSAGDFAPSDDTATGRAFAAANLLAKAWTGWLKTDDERRRRTARPKTGETPWIMPESLNSPNLSSFPDTFLSRVVEQPLV